MKSFIRCIVFLIVLNPLLSDAQTGGPFDKSMEKLYSTLQMIDYFYVDSVKADKLTEDAITGMLEKLDPHSVYISKSELKEMNEPLVGNFEGVGIQFNILFDTIAVISPISGGPSEKLGIKSGDRIVKIDGINVASIKIKNEDVLKKLRGAKGTKVNVSIFRRGSKELIEYTIVRDKIPLFSIDASYMATPTVGYIKVNRFAQTTMDEFHKALSDLQAKGAKDLILDLNDNGGGYLNMAFELADEFLGANKLIVYTEGVKSPKKTYLATSKGSFEKGKLIVLVDEGSASASEIVSGAIQDWDRGLIIGRRSFGKGLVQNQMPLPDGSAIRLTIARYYTPVGRSIQKPYKDGLEKYFSDLNNRYKHGELMNQDSIKLPDSLKFFTPNKRVVYGGGGIMPDIFIPLDTTKTSHYFSELIRKGLINQFALSYVDKHRAELLKTYPSFETYKTKFSVNEALLNDLFANADKEGVKRDAKGIARVKEVLKVQIKALIARDLWKIDNFFEIINELNDSYKKALEVIKDDTLKKMKINSY
jgi:carboxyl-terminal processing protease